MSEIWYYADGENTVGPFGLSELVTELVKLPNPKNIRVWSEHLTDWMRADDIPELRRHLVKPPPLVKPPAKAEEKKSRAGWTFKKVATGAIILIVTLIAAAIGGSIGRESVRAIMKPSTATILSHLEAA